MYLKSSIQTSSIDCISDNLDWSKYITTTTTTKANARLSFIKRNLKDCPKTLKELAYFSLVRSFTDYCSTG